MEKLKRLTISFILMSVLSVAALAGETNSPPCIPGQTETPPCVSEPVNEEPTALGETSGPPASDSDKLIDLTAIPEAVLWALSLF